MSTAHGAASAATVSATKNSSGERAELEQNQTEQDPLEQSQLEQREGLPAGVGLSAQGPLALDAIELSPTALPASERAEPVLGRRSWLEVLALTLLPLLATAWLLPHDPLLLAGHFPWLVLVPVAIGVQHGALAAAVSSALLASAGGLHQLFGAPIPAAALAAFASGCLASGLIAGSLRDRVHARLARLSGEARDGAERLTRLARAHAVLQLSHQKLEEQLAAHGWSLASAFDDARRALAAQSSLVGVGEVVLRVLSNHALVQSATWLTHTRDGRGRPALEARARLGGPPGFEPGHALVQRALDTGRLVALDAESSDGAEHDVLAVAPLVAASGRLLGLVVIHEMPFMAFQAENLKGLAALSALLADMLEDRFIEAHAEGELLAVVAESAQPLAAPSSETRAVAPERGDERAADERATEQWLEDELASSEVAAEPAPAGEFVGTRTGLHRRRGVAQSA